MSAEAAQLKRQAWGTEGFGARASLRTVDRYGLIPSGHRHGRGADPRTIGVLGIEPFPADVLAGSGLMFTGFQPRRTG
ncbi:MAG: Ornithine decarboxylase [Blastococcus sp.]|nr:Ornithine decarboxylase [Blastococcus sp.]